MGNYGLGGGYRPHHDMALDDSSDLFSDPTSQGGSDRNRIATVLFYVRIYPLEK